MKAAALRIVALAEVTATTIYVLAFIWKLQFAARRWRGITGWEWGPRITTIGDECAQAWSRLQA